jgi:hypothetical protein
MVSTDLKKTGNELGAKTTYQLFLEREALPVIRAFHVEDIREVELHPWARMGGYGVYLNLEGRKVSTIATSARCLRENHSNHRSTCSRK